MEEKIQRKRRSLGRNTKSLKLIPQQLYIVVEKAADRNLQGVDIQSTYAQEPTLSLVHNIAHFGFLGVFLIHGFLGMFAWKMDSLSLFKQGDHWYVCIASS